MTPPTPPAPARVLAIRVRGTPTGQPRPRAQVRNGVAHMYTPDTARDWRAAVRDAVDRNLPSDWTPFDRDTPVFLAATFFFARPQSHFRANGALRPAAPSHYTKKPDADNVLKATLDAIVDTGRIVADDAQVTPYAARFYADTPADLGATLFVCDARQGQLFLTFGPPHILRLTPPSR